MSEDIESISKSRELHDVATLLESYLGRPVEIVTSPESIDVAVYRMKKVRDHRVFSRLRREMFDANENWVIAMTLKVVLRALRGKQEVLSILLSPDVVDQVKNDLKSYPIRNKIMIASKSVMDNVIGLELNNLHSIAALVNIAPKHLFSFVEEKCHKASQFYKLDNMSENHDNSSSLRRNDSEPLAPNNSQISSYQSTSHLNDTKQTFQLSIPLQRHDQNSLTLDSSSTCAFSSISNKSSFSPVRRKPSCKSIDCCMDLQTCVNLSLPSNLKTPILVLDDVRSSDNIGVILRTAFTLGIPTVLCTKTTFSGINARSARVSMGSMFYLDIFVTSNLPLTIKYLKEFGIPVYGTSPVAKEFIQPASDSKWAVVMGNEDRGASQDTLHACSKQICIPQIQGDSLSVATATAICLYELSRDLISQQRGQTHFIPDLL